jgi:molybdopterin-guanine dinucleotide biosynthesis protein A
MALSHPEHITGLILAGGRGTRMGGLDKGLQMLHGEPLVLHVAKRIASQADALLISANRHLDIYQALGTPFGATVIRDSSNDFPGPLAGLLAGLRAAHTELVLCSPCDSPCLPANLADRLSAALNASGADIATATTRTEGRLLVHPVFALVRTSLADDLAAYLDSGARRVRAWYARHMTAEVNFDDDRAFYNVNSLQELADLDRT